jgi:hypothetical protein
MSRFVLCCQYFTDGPDLACRSRGEKIPSRNCSGPTARVQCTGYDAGGRRDVFADFTAIEGKCAADLYCRARKDREKKSGTGSRNRYRSASRRKDLGAQYRTEAFPKEFT